MLRCTVEAAHSGDDPRDCVSLFARPYGGNRNARCPLDYVRGAPLIIDSNQQCIVIQSGGCWTPRYCTVAGMPQGKFKTSFPHEPRPPRLPLDHRFGMLPTGV